MAPKRTTPPPRRASAKSRSTPSGDALDRALRLTEDGRTAEALQAVEAILKENPDAWNAHRLAGVLLWRLGRDAESFHASLRAARIAPAETAIQIDLANSLVTVATSLRETGAAQAAFDVAQQVLKRFGATELLLAKTVRLRLFLGRASGRREDFIDALDWADEALRLFPNPAPADHFIPIHMHRSLALLNLGRLEESVAAYALGMAKPLDPKPAAPGEPAADSYAGLATDYDRNILHQSFSQRMAEFIARTIGPRPIPRALDAGCGTGLLATHVRAGEWIGIDASAAMLAKARERGLHGRLVEGDLATVMATLDGRFDLIASPCVLYHIADLTPFFRESARLLAPNGHLFLSVDPAPDTVEIARALPGEYAHSRAYLRRLARQTGLIEVAIEIMEHRTYPGFWCAFRQAS